MTALARIGTPVRDADDVAGAGKVAGTVVSAGAARPSAARAGDGAEGRHRDRVSQPLPAWPRLLSLELAGAYIGVSAWTVREWINDGTLPVVEARRPRTASALKHRPVGDTLRRLLVDKNDLDALADSFTRIRR